MKDAYLLAILLILLEIRRMWAEYRLARQVQALDLHIKSVQPTTVIETPGSAPKLPNEEKDTSVIKMTADRDARILEDEDDI